MTLHSTYVAMQACHFLCLYEQDISIIFSAYLPEKSAYISYVYNEPDFSDEYMPLDPHQHHDFFYYGFMAHGMYVSCCLASTGGSRPRQAQVKF